MDFLMIQSLGTYTKNMEMQLKWENKKEKNDFTADGSTKLNDPTARQAEEIRLAQADGSAKLSSQIRMKLASGKKLTQEEMEYLQKHDPQTYQKVKSIEAEEKSYEKKLKNCKTKEEVQQVRTDRVAASLSVVKSVESNSAIPEGAKLGIIWQELQKNMAMEEAVNKLVESGRYAQLPTEAEVREAEKALKEAKESELGMEAPAESAVEREAAEKEEALREKALGENASADQEKESAVHEKPPHRSKEDLRETVLRERRLTLEEAGATPEALKVKRAKAQAVYRESQVEIPSQIMDLKAE